MYLHVELQSKLPARKNKLSVGNENIQEIGPIPRSERVETIKNK